MWKGKVTHCFYSFERCVFVYVRDITMEIKLETGVKKYLREFGTTDETEKLDRSQNVFLQVTAFQMIYRIFYVHLRVLSKIVTYYILLLYKFKQGLSSNSIHNESMKENIDYDQYLMKYFPSEI